MSALILCSPPTALAHPLGNDNIETFSVLYLLPDRVELDLLVDINETPAGIMRRDEIDANNDDDDTVEEQTAWLDRKARDFAPLLIVKLDDTPVPLEPLDECFDPVSGERAKACRMIIKMPGFAGMPTYRLMIRYGGRYPGPLAEGPHRLVYTSQAFSEVAGLRRVLLEETCLAMMTAFKFEELSAGPAPATLLDLVNKRDLRLSSDAVLRPAGADEFLLLDGDRCLALAQTERGLGLFRSPYVRINSPRPAYWNEGLDPFLYQQYDPANLPREASVTIGFVKRSPCAATQPAAAPAGAASTGTSASAGTGMPAYLSNWNDPRNDPALTSEYYRQADDLVGKLQRLSRGEGFLLFLTITFLAFTWGAGHALMPGHAKTVVAAYLISQRGTYWHAVLLAVVVTVTHTALVVLVGLIVYFYQRSNPNLGPAIQLWLGTLAGVLVAVMGVTLIWRALTGRIVHHHHDHDHHHADLPWWRRLFTHSHAHLPVHGHRHPHDHGHSHDHTHAIAGGHSHGHTHGSSLNGGPDGRSEANAASLPPHSKDAHDHAHSHTHDHHDHTHELVHHHGHARDHAHGHSHSHGHLHAPASAEPISTRMLLLLGITGGIVPCPTAMIILLLGIGANVVALALYAVGVFSLGLALTLMLIGFAALASRRFATRLLSDAEHEGELSGPAQRLMFQVVPALSGLVVVALGCMIAANYLYTMRGGRPLFPWLG